VVGTRLALAEPEICAARRVTTFVVKRRAMVTGNFRGFGRNEQSLKLDRDLVLFYGPNGYPLSDSPHFK
jgi:hypothetical protein